MSSELGRELAVPELVRGTVVILQKEGRPMITCWVDLIGADYVTFFMGSIRTTLIAAIREDGSLGDDSGMRLRVFEYLGVV